jgi:hypothetical protein
VVCGVVVLVVVVVVEVVVLVVEVVDVVDVDVVVGVVVTIEQPGMASSLSSFCQQEYRLQTA